MASLYQAFVEVVPETRGLQKRLNQEFSSAGPGAGAAAGRGINDGVLGSIGKLAGPIAGAFAAIGIGGLIKNSIDSASDFEEGGTAVTAVFGEADKTIQAFAKNAATSLGQSTNMTLDAARTFGTFGKAAGLGGEDLADFSTEFITLAGDLASFNNTTPEEAIEALGGGLRGEAEPLRKYGILLDDAALKARATELGIYSGTGALTAQQKVLASQAEIMAQTSVAQGDFAKTSGGLANQQRILSAGLANLSSTFGAILLPAVLGVVGLLNTVFVPTLEKVVGGIAGVKSILVDGDFTGAFADAFNVQEDAPIVDRLFDIRDGFLGVRSILLDGDFTAAFSEAFNIQEDSKIVDYLFRIREGVLGTKALLADGDFTGDFRRAFNVEEDSPVVDFLFTMREAIAGAIPTLADIGSVAGTVFGTLGTAFAPLLPILSALVPQVLELWQSFSPLALIFGAIGPMLPQLLTAFVGLAATIGGALGSALTLLLPSITEFSTLLVGLITGLITTLLPIIVQLVSIMGPILGSVITAILPLVTMLMGVFTQLFAAIMPLLAPILGLIVPLVQLVGAILPPLIALIVAILEPIIAVVSGILGLLIPALTFIVTAVAAVISAIVGVITWFVNLVAGAEDVGTKLNTFFTELPQQILAALGDLGETLFSAGGDLIQGFIDGIQDMIGGVGEAVGGVMDFVGGFFPHSPAKRGPFSGSGWSSVKNAGLAIGDQFGAGLSAAEPGFNAQLESLVPTSSLTAKVDASVYGSAAGGGAAGGGASLRPIVQNISTIHGQSNAEIAHIAANDLNGTMRGF
jgi:hypothetical protein